MEKVILIAMFALLTLGCYGQEIDTTTVKEQREFREKMSSQRETQVDPDDVKSEFLREESTTTEYRATVLSSNFTVPIIRYNRVNTDANGAPSYRKGNVSFFNSVGAGVGIYWGRLTEVTDSNADVINTEMDNTVGLQTGFLFASNTSANNTTNIFAWTIGLSLLNFQVSYGYELGTVSAVEKRGFLTLAYGIPISKLVRGGFFVLDRKTLKGNSLKRGFIK